MYKIDKNFRFFAILRYHVDMNRVTIEGLAEYLQQGHGRLAEFERVSRLSRTTVRRLRDGGKVHKSSLNKALSAYKRIIETGVDNKAVVTKIMITQLEAIEEYRFLNPDKAADKLVEFIEDSFENRYQYAHMLISSNEYSPNK